MSNYNIMKNNKIKIKKRLNRESFDTLFRLSSIAYKSKNSLEGFLIDQIILSKAKEINLLPKDEICEIANDNSNAQVVVSGRKNIIDILYKNLKTKKKRGIILPVSAPFHCSLMKSASNKMESKIKDTDFKIPSPSIISNVTAKQENDTNVIKSLLIDQITSRVRWRESISYMINEKVTNFVEIGPGKVLSGLVKKIDKEVKIKNISSLNDIENDQL